MHRRSIRFHLDQGVTQTEGLCRAGCLHQEDATFAGSVSPGCSCRTVEPGGAWQVCGAGRPGREQGSLMLVLRDRAHPRTGTAQLSPSVGESGWLPATCEFRSL